MRRERGAAALALLLVLVMVVFGVLAGTLPINPAAQRDREEQEFLALAAQSLAGYARTRRCEVGTGTVASHLPCPDMGSGEGWAAPSCPATARGRLPWRTLGLAPLRDAAGECLWYERTPTGSSVIAPGRALAGQTRAASGAAPVCGGHYAAADYLELGGNDRAFALDAALLSVPGGC